MTHWLVGRGPTDFARLAFLARRGVLHWEPRHFHILDPDGAAALKMLSSRALRADKSLARRARHSAVASVL